MDPVESRTERKEGVIVDKKPGCFLKFIYGSVIVLVLVVIAIAVTSGGEDKQADDVDPSAIYTQAVQTVWAEYTQTAEAIEPTEAPLEIEPTQNNDDLYITSLYLETVLCSDSMGKVGEVLTTLGNNISLYYDSSFMADLYTSIDDFEYFCTDLYDENPPVEFIEMNNVLKGVDDNYKQAVINLRLGLETFDSDKLDIAGSYLTAGTQLLNEATALIPGQQ